ncbi:hypothetical protein FC093_21755 [Ilyomonas limi]|uniref:Uncharacterized protein n=1 Tax=Ilyomonas limi TaxID=2575867 RepID=A0A4U3KUX1_9BACT|nr:hypothetical protein [Ilyomonas limi]TKK64776.1 hypothetical protein FC093_21755 [Ilyomonas limi]
MNYQVVSNNHTITVLEDDAFPLYTLSKETVQEIADIEGTACAECILNLSDHSQLPTNVLYEIAFYIQRDYPYLCIDWFTTFYYVEKESYLRTAFVMKELLEEGVDNADDEQRKKRFEKFESYELVYDTDTVILKIVMMNIINFNVIIK